MKKLILLFVIITVLTTPCWSEDRSITKLDGLINKVIDYYSTPEHWGTCYPRDMVELSKAKLNMIIIKAIESGRMPMVPLNIGEPTPPK